MIFEWIENGQKFQFLMPSHDKALSITYAFNLIKPVFLSILSNTTVEFKS